MHTIMVIAAGLLLLGASTGVSRWMGFGDPASVRLLTLGFLAVWLAATVINLWFGVTRAGYTVAEETPINLVVFLVPTVAAILVWWLRT
ncbi:MAG: hypothetical protein HXX10_14015 [Rhodoplanes sp.]|uniref:hypothetical protein n=1 Tax=Rhodoplanes sp. TaxID=1968906 RepID=UPI0017FF5FE2|nr:hypothetical protein [Rhodoplanes sp.]NVO15146.1 hypothetical protein [Rhodoplanes sp.]